MVAYDKIIRESLDKLSLHLRSNESIQDHMFIKTKPDMLVDLVRKRKRTMSELCNLLDVEERILSNWVHALEEKEILKIKPSLFG